MGLSRLLLLVLFFLPTFTCLPHKLAFLAMKRKRGTNHKSDDPDRARIPNHEDDRPRKLATAATVVAHGHLDRFFDVEPEWKGSSYSYARPPSKKSFHKSAQQRLEFPCCGSITIEQHSHRAEGVYSTGFALWSAALAISEYLDARCGANVHNSGTCMDNDDINKKQSAASLLPPWTSNATSLELGAGLGLPSIVLARHGWKHVVATEHDPDVLPLLRNNMQRNLRNHYPETAEDDSIPNRISIEQLDWARPQDCPLVENLAPDLIILSDLIWKGTQPVWSDLVQLLNRLRCNRIATNKTRNPLTRSDGSKMPACDPLVLMGYTKRTKDMTEAEEQQFFALLKYYGMEARRLSIDVAPYSDHSPLTVLFELRWVESEDEGRKEE